MSSPMHPVAENVHNYLYADDIHIDDEPVSVPSTSAYKVQKSETFI